jgi:hypothetical protein
MELKSRLFFTRELSRARFPPLKRRVSRERRDDDDARREGERSDAIRAGTVVFDHH